MNLLKKIAVGVSTVALPASMFFGTAAVTKAATAGGVYSTPDGTVWFVTKDMQKRPFTSAGAFLSYGFLNFSQVTAADASVTALPQGSFIAPADGKIFCATETKGTDVAGECALITGGKKASFTSAAVFAAQGHTFARAMYGDSSFLEKTSNISDGSAGHMAGVLVNNGGTVQMVVTGGLWGIPSVDVFNTWGYSFADVVPANSNDTAKSQIGVIPARMAGELVPTGTTGTTPPVGSVDCSNDGTEGNVDDYSVGSAEETTVAEDMSDVELVAFDVDLSDDGALCLDRFDLYMGQDNTVTASNKPWDYFTDAHLLVNGEEVDSMSVDSSSDWTEYDTGTLATTSQEYRLRFSGLSAGLAANEVSTVSVAFDTVSNLDSADEDAVWQFGTTDSSFRFTDGTGFTFTGGEDLADSFAFEAADTAALKISASTDNLDASVIEVSDTSDTSDVEIGTFNIEETNDVDVTITEMTVTLATTDTITDIVKTLYLYDGTDVVGQENVTGLTVTFDNIDLDINGDTDVDLTVKADLDDTNDQVRYQDGDTINIASVNLTEYVDAFDNDENDFTETGSFAGNAHALYVNGINVELVEVSKVRTFTGDATGEDDQGTYEIVFDVTAFGDGMYIDASTENDNGANAAGQGVVYDINSTAGTPTVSSALLTAEGTETQDDAPSGEFFVEEGETRTFTLTIILTADTTPTAGSHEVVLESINWATETAAELAGGVIDADFTNYYTFDLGDFKTGYLFLNAQ